MNFNYDKHTIFLSVSGSHSYGMSTENSDLDMRGIIIPPKEYFLGLSNFEQTNIMTDLELNINFKYDKTKPSDIQRLSLIKFVSLALDCNPNIIEQLFVPDDCILLMTDYWKQILNIKNDFLSTRAFYSFSGYAFSQLSRIKRHRRWLLNPPKEPPKRKDFDLPEFNSLISSDQRSAADSLIKKKIEEWFAVMEEIPKDIWTTLKERMLNTLKEISNIMSFNWDEENSLYKLAGQNLGYNTNFLEHLQKENQYRAAQKEWQQYQEWKKNRNPARAKMEEDFGYDLKHASHLKRLMDMAEEILKDGKVLVRRPNASELLEIRNGSWTYDKLIDWANKKEEELQQFYNDGKSILPSKPNRKNIENTLVSVIDKYLEKE